MINYLFILFIALLVCIVYCRNRWIPHTDFTDLANTKNYVIFPMTSDQALETIKRNQKNRINNSTNLKIALISLSVGKGRKFSEVSKQRLYQYASLNGYSVEYFDKNIDINYGPMWQKTLAVKKVLDKNIYDYVVWIDDDMYITNTSIKIEDFISLTDKDIILSRDVFSSDADLYINSGIFIIKNNIIGNGFINDTIDNYGLMNGSFKYKVYHEQSVMTYLFFTNYQKDIEVLPFNVMQSFNDLGMFKDFYDIFSNEKMSRDWREGDFISHFAGYSKDKRNELMPKMVGKDKIVIINGKEYLVTRADWRK